MNTQVTAPVPVTAFVDWNAQIHCAKASQVSVLDKARQTLLKSAKTISTVLAREAPNLRFFVGFRLYHGWYKGWEPTENLRAIRTTISETSFSELSHQPNVVFLPDVQYGHTLREALPERCHRRPAIHLPNTLRQQSKDSPPVEKMVDTALATDLLDWARSDPAEWALVLADDDDFVPPVFSAEAWIRPHGGRVFLVRSQRMSKTHLKLDGLLMEVR